MPLTQADKQQVDSYIQSGQPHLARAVLEGHLREEPYDEKARRVLGKINTLYPAAAQPPITPTAKPPAAIKRTQTNLETVAPARAAASVPTTDDMAEIKKAFIEKRYDEAEALLLFSNHPDAEMLRERLMKIRGGSGLKMKRDELPDFTNKLVICIVLLFLAFIPGLIALEIFVGEARKYPNAPGAQGLMRTRTIVYTLTVATIAGAVMCGLMLAVVGQSTDAVMKNIMLTSSAKLTR